MASTPQLEDIDWQNGLQNQIHYMLFPRDSSHRQDTHKLKIKEWRGRGYSMEMESENKWE